MAQKAGSAGIEPLAQRARLVDEAGIELGPGPAAIRSAWAAGSTSSPSQATGPG